MGSECRLTTEIATGKRMWGFDVIADPRHFDGLKVEEHWTKVPSMKTGHHLPSGSLDGLQTAKRSFRRGM
jgi:hypothetical protein